MYYFVQREAVYLLVVVGEFVVFEDRMVEQVRCHHWDDHVGFGECCFELFDAFLMF